ncbi:putative F-box protein At2g02030 [Prunus avium]|uniref:F-box protein At2g02030 n=1 Tax=Prunus avium TaxID=42229 RepID=A0A6P5TCB1_PRUAV|nr:putative F-box protein At2g02030 [Prunus avium]
MCMRGGGTRSMCTKRSYRARISQYLPSSSCHDHDHQSDFKRSKKLPISSSKFTSIDDLPDHILVEILCRLPQKSTSQYKCVSKNWYLLISDPYFFRRFLCIQHERQNPIKHTLIFSDNTDRKTDFFSIEEQLGLHSKHRRKFSFSFLPCYGATGREPLVVGTYKDLVCCCATWYNQRDYYICNPYTKQWVALPPTPRCHKEVRAGFICNPKHQNDDDDIDIGDRKQESNRYRYKIVQIIIPMVNYATPNFQFNLQMFCSESGKWTEAVALSPQSFVSLSADAGVAHNGMLYWRGHDFIFGLDPFSNDNPNTSSSMITDDTVDHHTFHCRFIGKPDEERRARFDFLGVCRGRLRMCQLFVYYTLDGRNHHGVSIWELKEDDHDHEANNKWCLVHIVYTDQIVSETPLMSRYKNVGFWERTIMVQDFDPNNEHVLYLQLFNRQVMYDLRTRTLEVVMLWPFSAIVCLGKRVFTFVIPWWPTLQYQYAYASPS